jgi:hypothetical protein
MPVGDSSSATVGSTHGRVAHPIVGFAVADRRLAAQALDPEQALAMIVDCSFPRAPAISTRDV